MISKAFDLGEELKLRELSYKLYNSLWILYDLSQLDLSLEKLTSLKYLNAEADGFGEDVVKLPANTGGLYMFSIKYPIIPGMTDYPVYIGRALYSDGQNLNKRCREYFNKYARSDERPKITRMFKYWASELYLSFIPLNDNDEIADYEKRLINSLLLPFNHQIPDVEIRQAVKAFNL